MTCLQREFSYDVSLQISGDVRNTASLDGPFDGSSVETIISNTERMTKVRSAEVN